MNEGKPQLVVLKGRIIAPAWCERRTSSHPVSTGAEGTLEIRQTQVIRV